MPAIDLLSRATQTDHHQFWPCTVSVLDTAAIDSSKLHNSRQVTDAYLLALAVENCGRFITFDQSIALAVVPGAREQHLVVL